MVNIQRIYDYLDTIRDTLAEKFHLFVGKRDGQIGLIFSDCDHTYKLITLDERGEVITINGPVKENFAELVEEMYRLKNGADVLSADDAPVELCGEVLLQLAAIAVHDEGESYEYLKGFVNRDSVKEVFGKKKEYTTVLGEEIEL